MQGREWHVGVREGLIHMLQLLSQKAALYDMLNNRVCHAGI